MQASGVHHRISLSPIELQPAIHRLQPIVMFHVSFPGTILLSDRNRGDLDWSNGSFRWTYRNRFTGERRLTIRSYQGIVTRATNDN